jgi:CubicO group peptidase (beta-lactamase class C family)
MRAILILLFISILSSTVQAQNRQQQKADSVFLLVKKYFNEKNTDAIYGLAGVNFKKDLSLVTLKNLFDNQLYPLGEIKESAFISFKNNKIATYKLKYASLNLQLLMSLDDQDKLELFLLQPYKEPAGDKTALAASSNALRSLTDRIVDSAARTYIQKANTVGMCIGVLKDGKVTTYGYGETVKGNGKLPNTDNFFEIGSITKTFTATILAYYVNQGKIKLSDPVTQFLPDSVAANPALKGITLVSLSNHTSGLPSLPDNFELYSKDPLNPYKSYTKASLYAYLKTCKLKSTPGERYAYSNLAVGLLGTILEKVSGQTFEQMVTTTVCKPLGMLSTAQYLNPLLSPRFVQVYNEEGNPTPAWDFDVLAPCGALRSTMSDLLLYTRANMHSGADKLSKALALTHQLTFNKDVKLGLGWHIITIDGVNYYFHNGGTYGSSSFLAFNTEKNIAVIILSNARESTDKIGIDILKKLQ